MAKHSKKEKASFEAFSFLFNHNINLASSLYDKTERRRGNVLTVMSFCLIGEMTFIAAQFDTMISHWWSWIVALFVFATWLAAFILTIRLRLQMCEIVLYPTGDTKKISFLPCDKEINSFDPKNITRPSALSQHIMNAYFERKASKEDAACSIGVLEQQYYEALNQEVSPIEFSENTWLADSTIRVIHAIKLGQWARNRFKRIYIVFTTNLVLFFGMMIVLVVFECLRHYFQI